MKKHTMRLALFALGVLTLLRTGAAAPQLTCVTSPSPPGKLTVICGGPWNQGKPHVLATVLPDGPAGMPNEHVPPIPSDGGREVQIVQESHGVLTCLMPEGPFAVLALWGRNGTGQAAPVLVNKAEIDWVYPQFPTPGQTVESFWPQSGWA